MAGSDPTLSTVLDPDDVADDGTVTGTGTPQIFPLAVTVTLTIDLPSSA